MFFLSKLAFNFVNALVLSTYTQGENKVYVHFKYSIFFSLSTQNERNEFKLGMYQHSPLRFWESAFLFSQFFSFYFIAWKSMELPDTGSFEWEIK